MKGLISHPTKLKCSNSKCTHVFKFHNIEYPIINDPGVAVFKCPECGSLTKTPVYNYDVFSRRDDCIKCLEVWECENDDYIASINEGESREDEEEGKVLDLDIPSKSVWAYYDESLIGMASAELERSKKIIDDQLAILKTGYLAGAAGADDINRILVKINIGEGQFYLWAKEISSYQHINREGLKFAGTSLCRITDMIDGVKDREECFSILNYMLFRWKIFAEQVFFVSPFIGFQYKSDKYDKEIRSFWEWLGQSLDLSKTKLITRKTSIRRLIDAYKDQPQSFEYLLSWDDFNDVIKLAAEYDGRKPGCKESCVKLFQHSHAKFYAGVFKDYVEVLNGSYNIHRGKTLENLSFKRYSKEEFNQRFLNPYSMLCAEEESSNIFAALIEVEGDSGCLKLLYDDKKYEEIVRAAL